MVFTKGVWDSKWVPGEGGRTFLGVPGSSSRVQGWPWFLGGSRDPKTGIKGSLQDRVHYTRTKHKL